MVFYPVMTINMAVAGSEERHQMPRSMGIMWFPYLHKTYIFGVSK